MPGCPEPTSGNYCEAHRDMTDEEETAEIVRLRAEQREKEEEMRSREDKDQTG